MSLYYFVTNLQGDVVRITNAQKETLANYSYDAYGKLLSVTNASGTTISDTSNIALINPLRYRGYYYDSETELYYIGARYYDPLTSRWVSPEPNLDQGEFDKNAGFLAYNSYTYCANNPVSCADPDGEGILLSLAIGFAVGALISGVVKAVDNYQNDRPWYDGLAISVLAGGIGGAISCVPIPGVRSFVSAMITGAAGNIITQLIMGKIRTIDDLICAIRAGAVAGLLGEGASKLLSYGVTKYFGSLTKLGQKRFLSRIGKITNRQLTQIRQQIKRGLTPAKLERLIKRYGWDVLVSAFVSSTATSAE